MKMRVKMTMNLKLVYGSNPTATVLDENNDPCGMAKCKNSCNRTAADYLKG